MDASEMSSKTAPVTAFAAAYLTAPPALPKPWRRISAERRMEQSYLKLLNRLSCRIDIAGIPEKSRSFEEALELSFRKWFGKIYPKELLRYFEPVVEIYMTPDDPDEDDGRYLKISVSNVYVNWQDFEISQEVIGAEELWPGTGIAVLNALTGMPFRHDLWTPETILAFVRDRFWYGYETEREFLEAEDPERLTEDDYESYFPFSEKNLEYLKRWEKRIPARKYVHPVGRELIRVCREIGQNSIESFGFGSTFPEIILWNDEGNVLCDILEAFEQELMSYDAPRCHAGGTQWQCDDAAKLDRTLDQIELYFQEKEALTRALINFKEGMQPWLKKKTIRSA